MPMRLEHLENLAFLFYNTRQKPSSSPENPDIPVNESPSMNYAGGHTLIFIYLIKNSVDNVYLPFIFIFCLHLYCCFVKKVVVVVGFWGERGYGGPYYNILLKNGFA